MKQFKDYFCEYEEFYDGVLNLARMEERFSGKEASLEEAREYLRLKDFILSQCPAGTDIEDLIGLVVVGELRKKRR